MQHLFPAILYPNFKVELTKMCIFWLGAGRWADKDAE